MSHTDHHAQAAGPASREHVRAVQERRRSGAAGIHRNRADRRARTRTAAVRRAIKEG